MRRKDREHRDHRAALWNFPVGDIDRVSPVCLRLSIVLTSGSTLTGLPIMGAILDRQQGDFVGLELFAAVSVLVGCVFLTVSTKVLGKMRNTWKI